MDYDNVVRSFKGRLLSGTHVADDKFRVWSVEKMQLIKKDTS